MKRMKVLGVAMLAVFAVSAIAASAAQAAEFHSTIEKTFLFGEQEGENVFTTTAGKVKCKEASFDSLNAQVGAKTEIEKEKFLYTTATVTVQPKYGKCTAFGQAATVENGPTGTQPCDYHFNTAAPNQVTVTGTPVPAWGSPADVGCTITINVPAGNCMVTVNQQKPGTPSVSFSNTTFEGIGAVKVTSGVKGIAYTVEGAAGSICGEPGSYTNGEYAGNVIARGYKSSTHTKAEQVAIEYK
jgi:hypothetical protein